MANDVLPRAGSREPRLRWLATALVGYGLSGFVGQNLVFRGTTVSPLWIAAGIALGLGVRAGPFRGEVAAGVGLGQLVVFWLGPSLKAALFGGAAKITWAGASCALLPALGSSTGLLLALRVLDRWLPTGRLGRPRDIFALGAASFVQAVAAAPLGAAALSLCGATPWSIFADVAVTWGTGDWLGGLLVAPLFLMAPEAEVRRSKLEQVAALSSSVLVGGAVFGGYVLGATHQLSATYLCLLPLIWAAVRLPARLVAVQIVLMGASVAVPTLWGLGPFSGFAALNAKLSALQIFMAIGTLTALVLAMTEVQRREAQQSRDRKEAELTEARRRAEEGSRAKSDFIANMSHEIRTPLNGVLGAAQLLARTPLVSEQSELVTAIQGSGEGLLSLLNDLLDLSKIEAGKLDISAAPFDPRRLAKQVCDLFRPHAAPGVSVSVETDQAMPAHLLGDETRLRQIMSNLVGNAVKFTASGAVTVKQRFGGEGYVLEVIDTGIGIAPAMQATLFEPFAQGDTSTARRHGGTGLGLALCKKLAEKMHGRVSLESTPGQGTTLQVTLPLEAASAAPEAASQARGGGLPEGLRVLVAEDNRVNRLVVEKMLAACGARVTIATNGVEALDRWEESPCDVILMDCQMPELDGFAATRELRRREAARRRPRVPIIALTASALEGERDRCVEAGMDDFMAKPVQLELLRTTIARALTSTGEQAP